MSETPQEIIWRLEQGEIRQRVRAERFQVERDEALEDAERLRRALKRSAEALHGLSDDPEHLAHIFAECPSRYCVEAREALASPDGEGHHGDPSRGDIHDLDSLNDPRPFHAQARGPR